MSPVTWLVKGCRDLNWVSLNTSLCFPMADMLPSYSSTCPGHLLTFASPRDLRSCSNITPDAGLYQASVISSWEIWNSPLWGRTSTR